MSVPAKDDESARLLVLYRKDGFQQTYCIYCEQEEADSELKMMLENKEAVEEIARIWIKEKITYETWTK